MSLRLQLSEDLGYFPGCGWRLTRATGADRSPGKRSATGGLLAFAAQKIVNFATPIIGI